MLRQTVAILLTCVLCLPVAWGDLEYNKGFTLSEAVDKCDLVFVGRITALDFVFRRDILSGYTTDVVIEVTKLIKGKPNAGPTTVKFMILGGEGIHPDTGEDLRVETSTEVEYKLGDRRLFFLASSTGAHRANYPYDGLYEWRRHFGVQKVNDGKILMFYILNISHPNELKGAKMSLDVVLELAKATQEDKEGVVLLEDLIKTELKRGNDFVIELPSNVTSKLKAGAKKINDNAIKKAIRAKSVKEAK